MSLAGLGSYLSGILFEGLLIGFIFWSITFITMESTSLLGALRSALFAEVVGNLPYLWELPATSPPSAAMALVAAVIFVRLIMRVGELTAAKAAYGTAMTYFVLVAMVTCAA